MATAADYRLDGMPRVRVLCALTGELIYEPTHPWLEQVRCHLLKKWTWINKGIYLPTALTLFYLHFEVEQQPIDDFQCLGDLTHGRSLDIQCVVKAPQGLTSGTGNAWRMPLNSSKANGYGRC